MFFVSAHDLCHRTLTLLMKLQIVIILVTVIVNFVMTLTYNIGIPCVIA